MREYVLVITVRVPDGVRSDEIASLLEDDLRSNLDTLNGTMEDFKIKTLPPMETNDGEAT